MDGLKALLDAGEAQTLSDPCSVQRLILQAGHRCQTQKGSLGSERSHPTPDSMIFMRLPYPLASTPLSQLAHWGGVEG